MKIPLAPEPFATLLRKTPDLAKLLEVQALVNGRYLHWDQVRHRQPPVGLTHEAWWTGIRLAREGLLRPVSLLDKHGARLRFAMPDPVQRAVHHIDRQAAGNVEMPLPIVSEGGRDRYLVSSLIEEAITSSQLEGASTTQDVAKAMLRSGRAPRDRSEQMILNNYRVMQDIRELKEHPMTPEMLLEMHRVVTRDTLDDAAAGGRLRRPDEDIKVVDERNQVVLHEPPAVHELPQRLQRLCDFANRGDSAEPFVHPLIKAILLHFMLAYDHPFIDGNGRTARALFYWSLARSGYWLMEYVSISRLLKEAPARYARAFLFTETDENDATYFIDHQLTVIEKAIESLHLYLARKTREQATADALLRHAPRLSARLNNRQVALLSHALRHPLHAYTVASHQRSHRITPQTSRTDLQQLVELGLLDKTKRGRAFVYHAPEDLRARIEVAALG
jgi:Fic family protein